VAADLTIDIAWRLRRSWRAIALLRRVACYAASAEGFRRGSLSVVVVGSQAMSALHRRHLNLDGPTDVLTFDLGCDRSCGLLDAEIVLCADVARRRAAARDARPTVAKAELAL
jgi:ssRNA-specific RNase YbeY (16S rRNA maturation enzyme)